jgi:hypothetical protein
MRALPGLLVAALLAAGCLSDGSYKYFPPVGELPDGLLPVATDSAQWKVAAPFLGMQSNPGRLGVLDHLPAQGLGKVASVDGYLLQGTGNESYGILALTFGSDADVGAALAQGESHACDGKEMAHVLRDGLTYVLVGGDGSTAHGKQVLDNLAGAVQSRSGASLVC